MRHPGAQVSVLLVRSGNELSSASVEKDGSFAANGSTLFGGRYSVQLQNAPGYYLKSIAAKGAAFSRGELDIADGASVELALVAAKDASKVSGMAVREGKAFGGAMVLLIPEDLNRTDFIRRDQSDSDGTFTLNDVPPGRYTLFALDNGRDLEYQEPSAVKPYLSQGQAVNVPVPINSVLKIDVVSRQR